MCLNNCLSMPNFATVMLSLLSLLCLCLLRHVTSLQLANCFNFYGAILFSIAFLFFGTLLVKVYTGLFACFCMMCICLTLWCLHCFVYMWWSGGSVCRILSSPFNMFCLRLSGWNYLELFNRNNKQIKPNIFSICKTFFAMCLHNCYFYAQLCHCNAIFALFMSVETCYFITVG